MRAILSIFLSLFLAGCATNNLSLSLNQEPFWLSYIENNGTKAQVSFLKYISPEKQEKQRYEYLGIANVKFDASESHKELGDIYSLAPKKLNILLNLDDNTSINLNDNLQVLAIKRASGIKFYEFGDGIVESVVFSVDKGAVCENFLAKKVVNMQGATNYYQKLGDFFSVLTKAKFKQNGAKIISRENVYNITDKYILDQAKSFVLSAEFRRLSDDDIKKLGGLLKAICTK